MSSTLKRVYQRRWTRCCLMVLLVLGVNFPALAQQTDLIYLDNGDRVTGENYLPKAPPSYRIIGNLAN